MKTTTKMKTNETMTDAPKVRVTTTVGDLVKLSGIESDPNFSEWDGAVPMNADRTYPFNGRAISVYWKRSFEILTYSDLARRALNTGELGDYDREQMFAILRGD